MSAFLLKLIAALTMLIDHAGLLLFPGQVGMRILGRLAFPIYAFFASEGAALSKNRQKYLLRMLLCAGVSEIAFDLCLSGIPLSSRYQCTVWTLMLGILSCILWDACRKKKLPILLPLAAAGGFSLLAELLRLDYGGFGVLLVFLFFLCRDIPEPLHKNAARTLALGLCVLGLYLVNGWYVLLFALCAAPLLWLYDGSPGPRLRRFFYFFYPCHLLALYLIRLFLH